jgi:hypothetical protein
VFPQQGRYFLFGKIAQPQGLGLDVEGAAAGDGYEWGGFYRQGKRICPTILT